MEKAISGVGKAAAGVEFVVVNEAV